jgi:hypothetical protein
VQNHEEGIVSMNDNGGRRYGDERRQSLVEIDFQERRVGVDRRCNSDRRSGFDRRSPAGFRRVAGIDRRTSFISM